MSGAVVGVVVPAFNAGLWVEATLESLRSQGWSEWVCVVVDDGSTDDTAAIVERVIARDARVQLHRQAGGGGVSAARNAGLAVLGDSVEFVGFLDSDDFWVPEALGVMVAALSARPDAVGVFGLAEYMDERDQPLRVGEHPARQLMRRRWTGGRWWGRLEAVVPGADLTYRELIVGNPFWPAAAGLVRRAAVAEVGGFDETFRVQEDWDLWLRMSRLGPFAFIDHQLAWYRQHTTNLTAKYEDNVLSQLRLRSIAAAKERTSPDSRQSASGATGAWRSTTAGWIQFYLVTVKQAAKARNFKQLLAGLQVLASLASQVVRVDPIDGIGRSSRTYVARTRRAQGRHE